MRIKSGIYYWWSKQGSKHNLLQFPTRSAGTKHETHKAHGRKFIWYSVSSPDLWQRDPGNWCYSCNDPSSRSATSANSGGGTNTASFTQRQISWPRGPKALNIIILGTTSHSSLWHCSGVHALPDENEVFPHLPARLTWRNLNAVQAQASQLTPLSCTVYSRGVFTPRQTRQLPEGAASKLSKLLITTIPFHSLTERYSMNVDGNFNWW